MTDQNGPRATQVDTMGQGVAGSNVVDSGRYSAEQQLGFLAEASAVLSSSLDYQTTLTSIARLAVPTIADWCVVDVVDDDGRLQRLAATHVDPAKEALALEVMKKYPPDPHADVTTVSALRNLQSTLIPLITDDMLTSGAQDEQHLAILHQLGLHSVMAVPLIARDHPLGVLTFIAAESERTYDHGDLQFAEDLARRASLAIDNARLYKLAQEALHLREEFLSIASHELKTPLTAITLQLQMLSRTTKGLPEGSTKARMLRSLEGTQQQVRRLTRLTNDLLDVSRIGMGEMALDLDTFDLVSLTREVAMRFEGEATNVGSSIAVTATEPIVASWDRLRVDQILTNLISNAVKYGSGRPVEIVLEPEPDGARIEVRDQGIGIATEDIPRLFTRFERVAPVRQYSGLGLGLYIVRRIVEAHGGTIRVTSSPGIGSSFIVSLPSVTPQ